MGFGEQALTLPEELLLLSIDPSTGQLRTSNRLRHGVAGALLAELIAQGRVYPPAGNRIHVRSTEPTGDPLFDQAVMELAARWRPDGKPKGRHINRWVRDVGGRYIDQYVKRLLGCGLVGRVEVPKPFGRRQVLHRLERLEAPHAVFARMDRLLRSGTLTDEPDSMLAALAAAIGLDARFYPWRWRGDNRAIRRRMRTYRDRYEVSRVVYRLIREDESQ